MSTQQALPLPSPPSNTVIINARCSFRMEADQRAIVVAGLPVHHYRAEDTAAEAYAMVFLVESGFALQADVARAFGCSVRTVRRNQRRYAQGGMAALGHETGWRRGRRRISAKRLRRIEQMKSQGMSNRAIAHKLGVTEKAIRKQVGPTRGAASGQLALPGIRPPKKSAATAPPASSTGGDNDDDDDPGGKRSSSAASPPAAANDDEPVPKSLDRDASNRTLDRQLAYLGLLKDAAPLFRDGSSIPGAGVLFALPCLVESGLFRISRKQQLFTFTRLPPDQWKNARTTNAIERLHEEFKRRIKTQTVLPSAETAAMLFWALLASGQIRLRKVDGWRTLGRELAQPIDLVA